jgi:hypothetical protein
MTVKQGGVLGIFLASRYVTDENKEARSLVLDLETFPSKQRLHLSNPSSNEL